MRCLARGLRGTLGGTRTVSSFEYLYEPFGDLCHRQSRCRKMRGEAKVEAALVLNIDGQWNSTQADQESVFGFYVIVCCWHAECAAH
jgi:hypothetical protein